MTLKRTPRYIRGEARRVCVISHELLNARSCLGVQLLLPSTSSSSSNLITFRSFIHIQCFFFAFSRKKKFILHSDERLPRSLEGFKVFTIKVQRLFVYTLHVQLLVCCRSEGFFFYTWLRLNAKLLTQPSCHHVQSLSVSIERFHLSYISSGVVSLSHLSCSQQRAGLESHFTLAWRTLADFNTNSPL